MSDPALLPCPFCGGEAEFENVQREFGPGDHAWSVGCTTEECHGYQATRTYARKSEAATAWNQRSKPTRAGKCLRCGAGSEWLE